MEKSCFGGTFCERKVLKKVLLTMKLTTLFLFLLILHVSAENSYSQSSRVSLNLQKVKIASVLNEIEKQTNYLFFYNEKEINVNRKVDIHVRNQEVSEILARIFEKTNVDYRMVSNHIVLIPRLKTYPAVTREKSAPQSKIAVKGKVTATNGSPMPGVTVSVKGTTNGAITDTNGEYLIEVSSSTRELQFSFVGMKTQLIPLNDQRIVNVILLPDENGLDEVVVVGFGSQKKLSIVGAVTTIEPKRLQIGTTRSMSNNLAGQLAGVIGVQRSGDPGNDNSSFWIRGISTFGSNRSPLVLVDGIERSLDNIDPEEIASFTVLKDASASAVYGVRGANGVILINTKRGEVGKPKVTVRYEQGITQPVKLPQFIGAADYLGVLNSIREEEGLKGLYSQDRIDNIRKKTDPDLYPDVNWLDAITKDYGSNSRVNMDVSGGTDMLRYSMVVSYYAEKGIIARDETQAWDSSLKLKRYNLRSNVDLNVTPTTLFRFSIGGYLQDKNAPAHSIEEYFGNAFITPPFVHPAKYSTGEIPRVNQRENPWALATQTGYSRSSASQIQSLFSVEQDLKFIVPGLKAKGTFSFDRYSNNWVTRSKSPDYYNPATGRDAQGNLMLIIQTYGQQFLGYSTGSDWGDKSTYMEGNLTYNHDFGKSNVDAMFMYNQRHYDNGDKLPFRYQGIAGRTSYVYDRRYIGEFNFGYNGSENFARGHRYGFFPSVALGWLMSEEAFMEPVKDTFSKVKFRASRGLVGNDDIDGRRFPYITTIGDCGGYTWGTDGDFYRGGRQEGDQGNPNLTWETVDKSNLGFELGLWDCVELQADLFKEKRRNIFMQRQTIPGSSGFTNAPWANYGKVNNHGVDLALDVNKQLTRDFSVSIHGTLTYAHNKIIEQDEPLAVIGTNRSSTGKSVGQIFGLIADGLFTDKDFADISTGKLAAGVPDHTYGPVRPGDIKYRDVNHDGVINDLDRCAIGGTYNPELVYGFGANLKYQNVDFGFFFQGLGKTYRIIGGSNFIPGSANGSMGNILTNVTDRWTVANPRQDVFYPRLSDYQSANNNQASTWWLKDMSLLRLKNLELGYSLPKNLVRDICAQNVRFFVRGTDILTFSKFKLWDPEVDADNGLRYPIMKSYSFGCEVNF